MKYTEQDIPALIADLEREAAEQGVDPAQHMRAAIAETKKNLRLTKNAKKQARGARTATKLLGGDAGDAARMGTAAADMKRQEQFLRALIVALKVRIRELGRG